MTENEKLSFIILQLGDLVKKYGLEKALKILDCIKAIHEATKDFPDDIKEDAIQWVIDMAKKSTP